MHICRSPECQHGPSIYLILLPRPSYPLHRHSTCRLVQLGPQEQTRSAHTLVGRHSAFARPPEYKQPVLCLPEAMPGPQASYSLGSRAWSLLVDCNPPAPPKNPKQTPSPPCSLHSSWHQAAGLWPAVLPQAPALSPWLASLALVPPSSWFFRTHTVPAPVAGGKDPRPLERLAPRPHLLQLPTTQVRGARRPSLTAIAGTSFAPTGPLVYPALQAQIL